MIELGAMSTTCQAHTYPICSIASIRTKLENNRHPVVEFLETAERNKVNLGSLSLYSLVLGY